MGITMPGRKLEKFNELTSISNLTCKSNPKLAISFHLSLFILVSSILSLAQAKNLGIIRPHSNHSIQTLTTLLPPPLPPHWPKPHLNNQPATPRNVPVGTPLPPALFFPASPGKLLVLKDQLQPWSTPWHPSPDTLLSLDKSALSVHVSVFTTGLKDCEGWNCLFLSVSPGPSPEPGS